MSSFRVYVVSGATALVSALLWLTPAPAISEAGRVVRVTDGDTLVMLTKSNEQIKVRLKDIDAPERSQAFGSRSRETLRGLCIDKKAVLKFKDKDRYGRTLARVLCDETDASEYMVRSGMAWVYDKYVSDSSLYALQDAARRDRRGIWADPEPTPPWLYRRKGE